MKRLKLNSDFFCQNENYKEFYLNQIIGKSSKSRKIRETESSSIKMSLSLFLSWGRSCQVQKSKHFNENKRICLKIAKLFLIPEKCAIFPAPKNAQDLNLFESWLSSADSVCANKSNLVLLTLGSEYNYPQREGRSPQDTNWTWLPRGCGSQRIDNWHRRNIQIWFLFLLLLLRKHKVHKNHVSRLGNRILGTIPLFPGFIVLKA